MMAVLLYEAHITVKLDGNVESWKDFCKRSAIKPIYIHLSKGQHREQLMCAAIFRGDRETLERYLGGLETSVRDNGFEILRTKLECPLAQVSLLEGREFAYFETHMKLVLEDAQIRALSHVAEQSGTFASRNVFSSRSRGTSYILTIRDYRRNAEEARKKFDAAQWTIEEFFKVHAAEMECVIYDTNPELDIGWAKL